MLKIRQTMKSIQSLFIYILLVLLTACGRLEVAVDQISTPETGVTSTPDPVSEPLTMDSSSESIRLKMLRSYTFWKTIFVDGVVTWGAPEGSNLPSQAFHEQIWVDQAANSFRRIGGPAEGEAEYYHVSDGQSLMQMDLKSGSSETSSLPGFAREPYNPPLTVTDSIYPHPIPGQMGSPFGDLIFSSGLGQREGTFQVVAMEKIAGHPCLVVDWFWPNGARPSRYWIDVQRGIILREQDFGKQGGETIQNEYLVNQVMYDEALNSSLFTLQMAAIPQFSDDQGSPLVTVTPASTRTPGKDPLGQVYFFISDHEYGAETVKLLRLPGSCVTGAFPCPPAEDIEVPFNLNFSLMPLVWSPNGKAAAFAYPISQDGNTAGLYLFDPIEKSWKKLTEGPYIDPPVWSRDGYWLAFRVQDGEGGEDIYAIHPDGTGLVNLTASKKLPVEGRPYVMNSWINNNVILRPGNPGSDAKIYLMRVDDGYVKPLFDSPWTKSDLVPSPDGSLLAFSDASRQKTVLKILTPGGGSIRDLVTFQNGLIYPIIWSPDGMQIAFAEMSYDPAGGQEIYIIGRDGHNLQQVYHSSTGISSGFAFSPDGQHLLIPDMDAIGQHLFVVNLSTLEQRLLQVPGLRLDWWWLAPSWQPEHR